MTGFNPNLSLDMLEKYRDALSKELHRGGAPTPFQDSMLKERIAEVDKAIEQAKSQKLGERERESDGALQVNTEQSEPLPELDRLRREYRPTMDAEVLHSWAQDVVRQLTASAAAVKEREILGKAIHAAAVQAGLTQEGSELTASELLVICDDLADAARTARSP